MKKYLFILTLLFFLLFTGILFASTLRVYFLDVGQGDSTVIISSAGEVVMIDSGPDENLILQKLKDLKISHIDLLIASHPHADHISGMDKIIDIYKPRAFIDPGIPHTTNTYENLLLSLKRNNTKYYQATERKISLSSMLFTILPPANPLIGESQLNNNSAVIRLDFGKVSFLFPGDIEKERENQLVQITKGQLDVDILKVPHHGSSTGTTISFIQAVSPQVAVIFCGKGNSYGHPHQETIDTLLNAGIQIYRTDLNGTVLVETDGNTYKVIPEIGEARGPPDIIQTPSQIGVAEDTEPGGYKYAASKNSDVFHYSWCNYVSKIKPSNLVHFSTREEAIASGRRPCKRCKP